MGAEGDHPVYPLSRFPGDETTPLLTALNKRFGGFKLRTPNQTLTSITQILQDVKPLDDEWNKRYIIIADRTDWNSKDGLLLLNTDFRGHVDGMRMPISAASTILSMSIGNTDWEEYIENARLPCLPYRAIAVYASIDVDEDSREEVCVRINAGYGARKEELTAVCHVVDEAVMDLETAVEVHGASWAEMGCLEGLFIFLTTRAGEELDTAVALVRRDGEGFEELESQAGDVGEMATRLFLGMSSWEEERERVSRSK